MSALESRVSRLELRGGSNDVERVLRLYTEEELQASIDELSARVARQFAALGLGLDASAYTVMQQLAIIDECERLTGLGQVPDVSTFDLDALTDAVDRRSDRTMEENHEQASHMLEWLTNYRQKQTAPVA